MNWLKSILSALGNIASLWLWLSKRRAAKEPERTRAEIDGAIANDDTAKELEMAERGLHRRPPPVDG